MVRKKSSRNLPEIVYQDQYLLALNKPSGWVTLCGSGRKTPLQIWLEEEVVFGRKIPFFQKRSGIVHRLDKDTSGLLLVAKDKQVFVNLQKAFADRLIKKEYLALVTGKIPGAGTIKAPIKRARRERNKWKVFPQGRDSTTDYWRKKVYFYQGQEYSLIKVRPLTGRTHQIRVHFKYLGYPLVADPIYSSVKKSKIFDRLFLHASGLEFFHPVSKKKMLLESPLPFRLKEQLKKLES
ncbi:RluA family pseudouridine synthase [Candidatus Shapirobacteria bacterium]|nr:RluA family pseudouridine synthase [Candidatus Shapirobacteria bacterium]